MKRIALPRLAPFDMDIKSELLLIALSFPPYFFATTILGIALGSIVLQQELGPSWKVIAGAAMTVLCALIALIWTLVYQKIQSIELRATERADKMEVEFTRRQERIKQELRELEMVVTSELEADRQLRGAQHVQNSTALCQIMVKLGIDPSGLFKLK